ncbi:unnamed protein product, partial [Symbiodinium sp. KB8]
SVLYLSAPWWWRRKWRRCLTSLAIKWSHGPGIEYEQQGSQMTELQGHLAAQTQRAEALEAVLQGLSQLLVQDAEDCETETRTPPSPNMVDSPTSGADEEIEPNRRAIANSLLKHLYAPVGANAKKKQEKFKPCHRSKSFLRMAMAPSPLTGGVCGIHGGVVGFLSCGEVVDVIEEWSGSEGTLFFKLARGWVFNKTCTGTFLSDWQNWRGPEHHKAWTANNRDHQQGSWWNGRDCGGDQESRSSSSWRGQEDKWAWDQKDRVGAMSSTSMQGTAKSPAVLAKVEKASWHRIGKTMMVGVELCVCV